MPSSKCSRTPSRVTSSPASATVPRPARRSPVIASMSSVCPLPSTPAMPTISPAADLERDAAHLLDARGRRGRGGRSTSRSGSPGDAAALLDPQEHLAPDHEPREALLGRARGRAAVSTTLPRRSTVIRSAISSTSFSLWVMKMIDMPSATRPREDREELRRLLRREHRRRLVEDEDVRPAIERLQDLDALLLADGDVLDRARRGRSRSRTTSRAPATRARAARSRGARPSRVGSDAEHDVLGHRHHRDEHEVLVHHADPVVDRLPRRARSVTGSPLIRISPSSGSVEPVEDVHQRRLAGAVLAEQRVHLAARAGRGSTWSLATTPGKRFVIPASSRIGGVVAIGWRFYDDSGGEASPTPWNRCDPRT